MSEITKITTPLMPKENIGNRFKPVTDQAFELRDPAKVHGSKQQDRDVKDQDTLLAGKQATDLSRSMIRPLLRDAGELLGVMQKMAYLVEMGVSAADAMKDPELQALMKALYLDPEGLLDSLLEQDKSAVLFKGEAFSVLRDIMEKFDGNPKVRAAVANLLKTFEQNVNLGNSIKTILHSSSNILDYMFTKDRDQFVTYLRGLAQMLLPDDTEIAELLDSKSPAADKAAETAQQGAAQHLDQKEMAQILKSNLLPLLGEIVVKYHQNERIRDIVMVVVHNIVRVDQGTVEALQEALAKLVGELKQIANVPENFETRLLQALRQDADGAKSARNDMMSRLSGVIAETLRSTGANPAALRQAENMLMNLLQNQSSIMNVLHFTMPMQTQSGKLYAEMYVDPDSENSSGGADGRKNARRLFLSIDSEAHGNFELSFVQADERVEFAMWCPGVLVGNMTALKRQFSDLMQIHGYTMHSFSVEEFRGPHSIADVFPNLLSRRLGVDVRI